MQVPSPRPAQDDRRGGAPAAGPFVYFCRSPFVASFTRTSVRAVWRAYGIARRRAGATRFCSVRRYGAAIRSGPGLAVTRRVEAESAQTELRGLHRHGVAVAIEQLRSFAGNQTDLAKAAAGVGRRSLSNRAGIQGPLELCRR